jgi:hypothetical protein
MPRKPVFAVLSAAGLAAILLLVQAPSARSADPPERVTVTNFPEVQRVAGRVTVPEPVPQSALVRRLDVVVPPIDRTAATQLVEAGTVDAAGFTHAVLSLRGEVQGNLVRDGVVGLVLVPDEEPVLRALLEEGRFDFALEVEAPVLRAERGWFASAQPRHALGFPSYRVFLYNSSDRSVEADVYVYLTS